MYFETRKFAATFAALALCALPVTPSVAADAPMSVVATGGGDLRTAVVRIADLDLSHRAGMLALHQRLRAAARRVCEEDGPDARLRGYVERACVREALQRAALSVDRLHMGEPGRSALLALLARP